MSRLRARISDERGWALVSSVLVLGILVALTLPLISLVDNQTRQSVHERKSESSFNLTEAAFDVAVFAVGSEWPAVAANAIEPCSSATVVPGCPDPDLISQAYAGPDYSAPSWRVEFRDDSEGDEYYDAARVENNPTYDANRNNMMWVRADGSASGRDRTIVALVKRQARVEDFPRNAITAGWFATTNNGNKRLVDTKGGAAQPGPVAVRCSKTTNPRCLDYRPGQVQPEVTVPGYEGASAIEPGALDRLRDAAKSFGTYYANRCPNTPAGRLVFIEDADCGWAGGGSANSKTSPGMLVVANGTVDFGGGLTYYGLVYGANLQRSTGAVVTTRGAATIYGSIAIDGEGGYAAGSNGDNLVYDEAIFPLVSTFGGAVTVHNTWRELPAS